MFDQGREHDLTWFQLIISLVVSCVLFALTFALSGRPKEQKINNDLNSAGILQLTWLLGNESHFSEITRPDIQELRRAGLFDVQMSAWVESKARRGSADYDNSELIALNTSRSRPEA